MIRDNNYINDCNHNFFKHGSLKLFYENTSNGKQLLRYVNEKEYQDPDAKSVKLYEDLSSYYNNSFTPSGHQIISKKITTRKKKTLIGKN